MHVPLFAATAATAAARQQQPTAELLRQVSASVSLQLRQSTAAASDADANAAASTSDEYAAAWSECWTADVSTEVLRMQEHSAAMLGWSDERLSDASKATVYQVDVLCDCSTA